MKLEDKIKELDLLIKSQGSSLITSADFFDLEKMAKDLRRALLALEDISDCGTPLIEMYAQQALREILG